jgi:hypothetical protein
VSLRPVTVRFPPDILEAIHVEASRLGVSSSEFITTAAVAYLGVRSVSRGDAGAAAVAALYEAAHRAVEAWRTE